MTNPEKEEILRYCAKIEPALVPASVPHAALIMLRAVVGEVHTAASHAPRRGRRAKGGTATAPPGVPEGLQALAARLPR